MIEQMEKAPIFPPVVREVSEHPERQEVEYTYKVTKKITIKLQGYKIARPEITTIYMDLLHEDQLVKDFEAHKHTIISPSKERLKSILTEEIYEEICAANPNQPEAELKKRIVKREIEPFYNSLTYYLMTLMTENVLYFIQNIASDFYNTPTGTITRRGNEIYYEVVFTYTQPNDINEFGKYKIETVLPSEQLIPIESDMPPTLHEFLSVPSSQLYHGLQSAYESRRFNHDSERHRWPVADISDGSTKAIALLKPNMENENPLEDEELSLAQEEMKKKIRDMDDETADTLDVLSYVWLQKADGPDSFADISSYDALHLRGLKPKKSGTGRSGGFHPKQHKSFRNHMAILANTWIDVFEMEYVEILDNGRKKRSKWKGESAAIVIDSKLGQYTLFGSIEASWYKYKPGTVFAKFLFGPGRQTALLSYKALHYDPDKQQWEKRLARYFAWQWRIRQCKGEYLQPYTIETLLKEAVKEFINIERPLRTKNRFEKAIDRLLEDKVIAAWQYENWNESIVKERKWWKKWLGTNIIIEPPREIIDQYTRIELPQKTTKVLLSPQKQEPTIREIREKRRFTLLQAAEQIGISMSQLSKAERGIKGEVGKKTLEKIKRWIAENSG